jgi:hypothetical protein
VLCDTNTTDYWASTVVVQHMYTVHHTRDRLALHTATVTAAAAATHTTCNKAGSSHEKRLTVRGDYSIVSPVSAQQYLSILSDTASRASEN